MSVSERLSERPFLVLAWARDDTALRAALGSAASHFLLQTVRDGGLAEAFDAMTTSTRPHLRAGDPLRQLTPQERRILDLIGEGLTNREISVRLHIAEKTVKNYVTSLLAKLGMQRRAQAAAYIARRQARHTA